MTHAAVRATWILDCEEYEMLRLTPAGEKIYEAVKKLNGHAVDAIINIHDNGHLLTENNYRTSDGTRYCIGYEILKREGLVE